PSAEIRRDPNVAVVLLRKHGGHLGGLPVADLHDEVTRPGNAREGLVRALADERGARLPLADLGLESLPLAGPNVGRIRHDEVPPVGRGLEAAFAELDA